MPNPWLRWLCLRGPLQALPPSWWPVALLWGAACGALLWTALAWPVPGAGTPLAAIAEPLLEIALCWALLAVLQRRYLLKPALQALAMAALVRAFALWPLLWLLAWPQPGADDAGRLLLAFAGVLVFELALLAWLLRYWFRLWKQALGRSNRATALVVAGMGAALALLALALR